MLTQTLLNALLLGGLLGLIGQGIRMIVGLKKAYEEATTETKTFTQVFEGRRLGISLLIGFIAGVLGALALNVSSIPELANETLASLIGAGYAGTDFIEGFIRKVTPSTTSV